MLGSHPVGIHWRRTWKMLTSSLYQRSSAAPTSTVGLALLCRDLSARIRRFFIFPVWHQPSEKICTEDYGPLRNPRPTPSSLDILCDISQYWLLISGPHKNFLSKNRNLGMLKERVNERVPDSPTMSVSPVLTRNKELGTWARSHFIISLSSYWKSRSY